MRAVRRPARRSIAARAAASAGVFFLLAGFAVGTLLQPLTTLGQALERLNPISFSSLQQAQRAGVWLWLWNNGAIPLLLRPAWMLPTMLGLVLIGTAAQLAWGNRR